MVQTQPYKEPLENKKEVLNSALFLLFAYTLPGFTTIILEPEDRYSLGYIAIVILGIMVAFNLILAIISIIKDRALKKIREKIAAFRIFQS
jgi:hypothetical protein